MDEKSRQAIHKLAARTGLKAATIVDLVQNGWEYHEEIKAPPVFRQQGPEKG